MLHTIYTVNARVMLNKTLVYISVRSGINKLRITSNIYGTLFNPHSVTYELFCVRLIPEEVEDNTYFCATLSFLSYYLYVCVVSQVYYGAAVSRFDEIPSRLGK